MRLFVDTSAFIALADRTDQYHARATECFRQLGTKGRYHCSNYVLDETITRLRFTAGVHAAVRFAEAVWTSRLYQMHTVDQRIEKAALQLLQRYGDHPLSFTDCTTIALMEHLGIDGIFAFDDDFRKVGYHLLP